MKKEHVKSSANKVAGKVKEETGKATNDKSLEAEGHLQQINAKIQEVAGDAKSAVTKVL